MDESSFDVQLLLTSISVAGVKAPSPPSPNTPAAALEQLRSGTFLRALQTSLSHLSLPSHCTTTPECAAEWFQAVETATQAIIAAKHSNPEHMRWLLLTAVAALYTFTQANLTGPSLHAPENPFELLSEDWNGTANGATSTGATGTAEDAHSDPGFGRDSMSPEDLWATVQLAENGEDLVGRIHNPQYLLLAVKVLLIAVPNSAAAGQVAPAWSWWGARATLLQQRVLVGRSAVLRERLVYLIEHAVDAFAPSDGDLGQPGATLRHALAAAVLLEAATMETAYGHVGPAKEYTHRAAAVLGVEAELTGALGVRTVHQQDPRAQLILKIHQSNTTGAREEGAEGPFLDPAACGEDAALLDAALTENSGTGEEVKGLADESDVLRHPKLIAQPDASNDSTAGDGSAPAHLPALSPLHQAVLLAMCTNVKKGTASDGLQPWEVAAHADAVLQQGRGEFLLRTAAHLQLSRLERGRARTRERALLTLEGLAEGIDAAGGVPPEARMRCAFAVWFPLRVTLRKELGEAFVALGIVGAALPLFESLELWDNLIVCYRLMDKKVAAEELVKRRLEATPADPRLWCALGDLTLDDAHYLKAWELSGQRSARAQRSLARNAIRLERFADAAEHWETALALSPLHNEGWFTLGWCWIKEKNYPKALTALTRSAQMDPDNGEAWNNLAAVHMHLEHWKEAYAALSEAVKQKRDSWQTWENYAAVAVKVGEWQVACRAAGQVVALSNGERVDLEVLKALVQEVERGFLGPKDAADYENSALEMRDMNGKEEDDVEGQNGGDDGGAAAAAAALATMSTSDEGMSQPSTLPSASAPGDAASEEAAAHAAATLRNLVGKLMKQVAGGAAGDSAFWGVYARYYSAIGEKDAAGECLMKRVRALQGGASSDDAAAFQAYAEACTALARAHLASGQARELSQARMLLRAALRQGKERHSEVDAYREMEEALELVEQKAAELKGA